jgi:hypothetical protein
MRHLAEIGQIRITPRVVGCFGKHVIVETQEGHALPGRILSWAVANPDRRP